MKSVFCYVLTFFVSAVVSSTFNDEELELRKIIMPGVVLHKTAGPLEKVPVGSDFPGFLPAQFIQKAYDINVMETKGGKRRTNIEMETTKENNSDDDYTVCPSDDKKFGAALLSKARKLFVDRGVEHELDAFLSSGVSNQTRRMHWVGIEILPQQSLALHAHPNIEFAYIVEGVMHEWRLITTTAKNNYGMNLSNVKGGQFHHNEFHEGDMFINAIGDVHQSFTKEEGVKLFVMWGDGNADIPQNQLPQNATFLNRQSAQAWA